MLNYFYSDFIYSIIFKGKYLKNVVCFDELDTNQKIQCKNMDIFYLNFKDIIISGKQSDKKKNLQYNKIKPSDIYTFCYTSGTTGTPKGAMISHSNIVSALGACNYCLIIT